MPWRRQEAVSVEAQDVRSISARTITANTQPMHNAANEAKPKGSFLGLLTSSKFQFDHLPPRKMKCSSQVMVITSENDVDSSSEEYQEGSRNALNPWAEDLHRERETVKIWLCNKR
jgi:hypothetical protein